VKRIEMKMMTLSYRDYVSRTARLCSLAWVVCSLSFPSAVCADPIVADWDTYPADGLGNWTRVGTETSTAIAENTTDADDHFLEITFDAGISGDPGDYWFETVSVPRVDLFTGDWTGYSIEFDFWADSTLPDTLQIRWGADGTGRTWGNDVTPSGVGSWDTLRTDTFSSVDDWRLNPFVDQDDFLADLGAIDWIGVYIFRDGTDEEIYGVDNFGLSLMVPEPEEYLMLAMALVTAFFVMRRQKSLPTTAQLA
jgi:hypothetical protein